MKELRALLSVGMKAKCALTLALARWEREPEL